MILVTGFAPYKEEFNASGELVESLKGDLPRELLWLENDIEFELISVDDTSRETEHSSLEDQLQKLLHKYNPEFCIFTGQAPPYNKITIEKIATNSFMRDVIDSRRPVAYWSNLPGTDSFKEALEEATIPAAYSFYGGQHLCNHILYSSLYYAEKFNSKHKSGFIHIPLLPKQVVNSHRESPFMALDMLRKAMTIIINQVYTEDGRNEQLQE